MSENIESKRELHEHHISQMSLKIAHYGLIDDITKRCNVCDKGTIVLFDGCRLCQEHRAFVTCGATCDLHNFVQPKRGA